MDRDFNEIMYLTEIAGCRKIPTKYLKSLLNFNIKKSKMVKTVGKMGQVLGLTKNNDLYEDVPDDLKWAIPLHEHLVGSEIQKWFDERKAQSEQRVEKEVSSLQREALKKRLKILGHES